MQSHADQASTIFTNLQKVGFLAFYLRVFSEVRRLCRSPYGTSPNRFPAGGVWQGGCDPFRLSWSLAHPQTRSHPQSQSYAVRWLAGWRLMGVKSCKSQYSCGVRFLPNRSQFWRPARPPRNPLSGWVKALCFWCLHESPF